MQTAADPTIDLRGRLRDIGDRHEAGVPDRTRFKPVRAYVEEVVEKTGGAGVELPADLEQKIERVVADRLAVALGAILPRLDAVEEELQRRKGGRPAKKDD